MIFLYLSDYEVSSPLEKLDPWMNFRRIYTAGVRLSFRRAYRVDFFHHSIIFQISFHALTMYQL